MSKSIMLSIRPKYVAKILNGKKTIEIRKKFPSDYVGWVYIYCTKDKKYANLINRGGFLTGMVVARFWCNKVEEYINGGNWTRYEQNNGVLDLAGYLNDDVLGKSCLTEDELFAYCEDLAFSAIHITNLDIFDKPKEIKEFYTTRLDKDLFKLFDNSIQLENGTWVKRLTKAPQNYCYIEGELELL